MIVHFSADVSNYTESLVNSVVLGATLYEEGKRVVKFEDNVEFIMDFRFNVTGDNYNLTAPVCSYWEVTTNEWSTDGCELLRSNNETATCRCTHLTNFGVILDVNGRLENMVSYAQFILKLNRKELFHFFH
jgi:hypothetical protein